MLKITSNRNQGVALLMLEGRLAGPWVKELETSWRTIKQTETGILLIDLRGITFIEPEGKALLTKMWQEGAQLIATGCCNKPLVEEITNSRSQDLPHNGNHAHEDT